MEMYSAQNDKKETESNVDYLRKLFVINFGNVIKKTFSNLKIAAQNDLEMFGQLSRNAVRCFNSVNTHRPIGDISSAAIDSIFK